MKAILSQSLRGGSFLTLCPALIRMAWGLKIHCFCTSACFLFLFNLNVASCVLTKRFTLKTISVLLDVQHIDQSVGVIGIVIVRLFIPKLSCPERNFCFGYFVTPEVHPAAASMKFPRKRAAEAIFRNGCRMDN